MALDLRPGERVYQEIKKAILSGHFAIRQRLDIDKLASQLGVSATPVRYALAILASERLVKLNSSRMYQVAFWSERELRDLYLWRQQLMKWALETYAPAELSAPIAPERDYTGAYLAITRHLDANANIEARRAARAADDRLQPALRFEKDVLQDAAGDLARVAAACEKGGAPLAGALRTYFRRRIAHAAQIRSAAHASAIPDNGD
ncbi:MAG TPA: GntR family transcriptional regulator [Candidatus Binatia bacterium]|nr:GntR family transcriptional regulator [Candidatus Binatia bacterium]